MRTYRRILFLFVLCAIFLPSLAVAETLLKPYYLASNTTGVDVVSVLQETKQKLEGSGFEIVGEYSPYPDATIVIITNDALKLNAAATEFGGFGAALHVTITKVNNEVQLAYTNPVYMANAYRMKSDLADVAKSINSILGYKGEYGPAQGLAAEDLRGYHYKWLMPYFNDRIELATYKSYDEAIAGVSKAMSTKNKGGVKQVYRVDIPGKQQSVIGVSMSGPSDNDCSGDKYIMDKIDFKPVRSTGHLPYEMLVSGNTVYTLPAEFRIAISFPDLSMMGSNSFASIMCAPTSIQEALTYAAGGNPDADD